MRKEEVEMGEGGGNGLRVGKRSRVGRGFCE